MTQANLADLGHEKLAQLIQDAYNEGYQRGLGDGYHQAREDARSEAAVDYDGQPDEAQEWYDFDPDC